MTDSIEITIVETPIEVDISIEEDGVAVDVETTETPVEVTVEVTETPVAVAVAITETPIEVDITVNEAISNHNELDNLAYADAGHTGFQIAGSYLTVETDPVFLASEAVNIDAGDITNLGNLSGINTGDQNNHSLLSNLDYASAGHTGFAGTGVSNIFSVPQAIVGSTDAVQFYNKFNATQTANGFENRLSDNTVVSGFDERGILFSDGGTSVSNVFLGDDSGNINNTAGSNLAIGSNSLSSLIAAGSNNVGIGTNALEDITDGQFNVGIGTNALRQNSVSHDGNVSIGYQASSSASGDYNVGIGMQTMLSVSDDYNTALGYRAGFRIAHGKQNIFIGSNSGARQTTNDYLLIIDNQQRADIATEATNSILYGVMAATPAAQTLRINAALTVSQTLEIETIKSGATQVAAGAAADEVWKTASHATLPDNVLLIGV